MKKGSVLLTLTAFIWGMAFVAQSVAMDAVGPWTFNCLRSLIAFAVLAVLMPFLEKISGETGRGDVKLLYKAGILTGLFLAVASMLQQTGIIYTTVGKAGFITALYVIFVPVFGILLGKKPGWKILGCTLLAVLGLYFLCMSGSFRLSKGDTLVFLCAIFYALQIMCIDHYTNRVNAIRMSCIQFLTVAVLCGIGMVLFEHPDRKSILAAGIPILYAGVMSSGAGYTMQIIGQKDTDPALASLLMSLESVFAVLGGFVLLHQTLSPRELLGCALTFAAVVLAQIPVGKKLRRKQTI